MGPRSFDRGKHGSPRLALDDSLLQWGRDLSIAERLPDTSSRSTKQKLQWGRDLSIAERATRRIEKERLLKLQWGRDLSIAERPTIPDARNSMGPRSFDRGKRPGTTATMVSGSSFNGAAIFRSRKDTARGRGRRVPPRASMGPRSFDRGKAVRGVRFVAAGRRFNGAAIFRSRKGCWCPQSPRTLPCFNGAAIFRSRKAMDPC